MCIAVYGSIQNNYRGYDTIREQKKQKVYISMQVLLMPKIGQQAYPRGLSPLMH